MGGGMRMHAAAQAGTQGPFQSVRFREASQAAVWVLASLPAPLETMLTM